jgi:processing peptidase subunit alpha
VFGGEVKNPGNGSGAPTVVLQQGEEEGVKLKQLPWTEIQDRITRWGLGKK